MPNLETPGELADELANLMGVYGSHTPRCGDHASLKTCECRICFVTELTARIRQSVANENLLNGHGAKKGES